MTVRTITITGDVARSKDYQSTRAGFEVVVELGPGENPKKVFAEVYRSMSEAARHEAEAGLAALLYGPGGDL